MYNINISIKNDLIFAMIVWGYTLSCQYEYCFEKYSINVMYNTIF